MIYHGGLNTTFWANASKGVALASSAMLSYLTMRLWVFARLPYINKTATDAFLQADATRPGKQQYAAQHSFTTRVREDAQFMMHSLSVVLPVYNEEEVIAVRHLPRRGGRATGASLRVVARAFRELFSYVWMQRRRATLQAAATRISR